MSAAQKITVDDLREKAEEIQERVRVDTERLLKDEVMKTVLVGAAVVALTVSFAYYVGTRRCR